MDQQTRELQQKVAAGDVEAKRKLDQLNLRSGKPPSFDYLVEQWQETKLLLYRAKITQDKWGKDFDYQLAILCGKDVPTDEEQRWINFASFSDENYPNWGNNL